MARGASDGLKLAFNIAAMLLVFIAVVYMINHLLGYVGDLTNLNNVIQLSSNGQFEKLSLAVACLYFDSTLNCCVVGDPFKECSFRQDKKFSSLSA